MIDKGCAKWWPWGFLLFSQRWGCEEVEDEEGREGSRLWVREGRTGLGFWDMELDSCPGLLSFTSASDCAGHSKWTQWNTWKRERNRKWGTDIQHFPLVPLSFSDGGTSPWFGCIMCSPTPSRNRKTYVINKELKCFIKKWDGIQKYFLSSNIVIKNMHNQIQWQSWILGWQLDYCHYILLLK